MSNSSIPVAGSTRHAVMTRFHELDALRAFAMLLGVVLHAVNVPSLARMAGRGQGRFHPSLPYDDIVHAIHGFRMPVFFLLSGLFTAVLWRRYGVQTDSIKHRPQACRTTVADRCLHDRSDPCLVDRVF